MCFEYFYFLFCIFDVFFLCNKASLANRSLVERSERCWVRTEQEHRQELTGATGRGTGTATRTRRVRRLTIYFVTLEIRIHLSTGKDAFDRIDAEGVSSAAELGESGDRTQEGCDGSIERGEAQLLLADAGEVMSTLRVRETTQPI